jgi:CheY-like chemotaxis protein
VIVVADSLVAWLLTRVSPSLGAFVAFCSCSFRTFGGVDTIVGGARTTGARKTKGVNSRVVLGIAGCTKTRALATRVSRRWRSLKILTAHTGAAGIHAAMARRPRVILVDSDLPDWDDADLVRHLRRWAAPSNAQVFLVDDEGANSKTSLAALTTRTGHTGRAPDVGWMSGSDVELLLQR